MVGDLRRAFNAAYAPEKYRAFLAGVDAAAGTHVKFRLSETPCFFPEPLVKTLSDAGAELVHQLLSNPAYLAQSLKCIPSEYKVEREDARPLFVCVDFGLIRNQNGAVEPRLVEIQGFPSLYAFQPLMAREYIRAYHLDPNLRYLLSGLDEEAYRALLGRALLGGQKAENVVLMEIDPLHQKTLPDFTATTKWFGIKPVCITHIRKDGRKLYYEEDGRRVWIERIYNRVIVDELVRFNVQTSFDLRDELDVDWAGHPNWFFRISKFSLPFLNHYSVPRTAFLSDVRTLPDNLENYVLKPLFSFAGLGVVIGPSREQIEAIPENERHEYILQERMNFKPLIETPHGATKAEVRMMYLWMEELMPVTTIIRMGRGRMMGVDHNRDMEWVGASAALF
jgi:hypothetical protein